MTENVTCFIVIVKKHQICFYQYLQLFFRGYLMDDDDDGVKEAGTKTIEIAFFI